jgi:hypothetical protein
MKKLALFSLLFLAIFEVVSAQENQIFKILNWNTPEKQKNLLVWYDPQDLSTVKTLGMNSSSIQALVDKSNWRNTIYQQNTNFQPILISDSNWGNGTKNGVSFHRGGYMVFKFEKTKSINEVTSFVVCKNNIGGSQLLYDLSLEGGEGVASCYSGNNSIETRVPNSLVSFVPDFNNNVNKYLIISTRGKSGNIQSHLNESSYNGAGNRNFQGSTYNRIRLSTQPGDAPSNGVLYELILFDTKLSDQEFELVKGYLEKKYQILQSNTAGINPSENPKTINSALTDYQSISNNPVGEVIGGIPQRSASEGLLNTVVVKYDEVQSKVSSNAPNIKWVKLNNKFGFVNSDNFLITPIKYDKIGDDLTFFLFNEEFNEYGLCNVMVLNKWGLVDSNGVEVVAPKYDRQLNFKEGLALAIEQEKGVKVIDVKGNVRIDFSEAKYSGITSLGGLFKEGVMEVKYNGSWIYIDSNGVLTTNKFRTSAANSNPINLLGRVYTKSASNTNTTTIEFSYSSTGRSVNVANALGRQFQTDLYFTYKIDGNVLVITYENNAGTEKYTIDENSATLVSTHLQGYVDGKWGQIYWKREK